MTDISEYTNIAPKPKPPPQRYLYGGPGREDRLVTAPPTDMSPSVLRYLCLRVFGGEGGARIFFRAFTPDQVSTLIQPFETLVA